MKKEVLMGISAALFLWVIAMAVFLIPEKREKVIVTGFEYVTNPQKGLGIYNGILLSSGDRIRFEDKVCSSFGLGDTIKPMNILK